MLLKVTNKWGSQKYAVGGALLHPHPGIGLIRHYTGAWRVAGVRVTKGIINLSTYLISLTHKVLTTIIPRNFSRVCVS